MSEEVLTKEIAEQFNADEDSVDLSQYTSLDEEAAITLSKSDAWHINLDGVTDLSESVISVFVDHSFLPSLKGWSGMNDKLAELVLSSDCWTLQGCLSLDSKKLLIPYLPERFIMYTSKELDFSIEGYEVIDRESYAKLLEMLEVEGSVYVGNLPDHYDVDLEYSELVDSFFVYRTSEEAVLAFEETLGFYTIGSSFTERILGDEVEDGEGASIDEELEEGQELLLTEEIAQDIVEEYSQEGYSYSHEITSFSAIENKAMEILVNGIDCIPLSGLKQISDECAEILATRRTSLELDGLIEIPLSVAQIFVSKNSKLTEVQVDSVRSISSDVAECLSKLKDNLSLKGLVDFPDSKGGELLAKKLAEMNGAFYSISLPSLKKLSVDILNLLLKNDGGIELGIEELTPSIASALSKYKGNEECDRNKISLCRLYSFQDDALDELLKFKGDLHLDNITELSDSVAEKLSKFKGSLSLGGVEEIDSKIARFLGSHSGDFLSIGLLELTDPLVAQEIAKHKGCLDLPKIQSISDEAADALTKFKGTIFKSMSPFEISDVGAKSLSMIEDKLAINLFPMEKIEKALNG